MKKIQILGSGCAKCQMLADTAKEAAEQLGLSCEIEKITDVKRFAAFGVMMTPALVVDGKVVVAGKVPSLEAMKKLLA